jgi:hypothetical protein
MRPDCHLDIYVSKTANEERYVQLAHKYQYNGDSVNFLQF